MLYGQVGWLAGAQRSFIGGYWLKRDGFAQLTFAGRSIAIVHRPRGAVEMLQLAHAS